MMHYNQQRPYAPRIEPESEYLDQIRREIDEARQRVDDLVLVDEIVDGGNPYLDTFVSLLDGADPYDTWRMVGDAPIYARRRLVMHYSWAIPDEAALEIIGKTGSVVEIGAGGGYWAALLRARGVEVFAYDPRPGTGRQSNRVWTDVRIGWTRPAGWHPGSTLFLCWPAYQSRFAEVAVRRYFRGGGKRVVYVGEDRDGCCAEERFFRILKKHYRQVDRRPIPQYSGIHDDLTIWNRRP